MKILMVLFGFFPSDVRVRKEALTLTKARHEVKVLCCDEENGQKEFYSVNIQRVGKISDWEGRMTPKQLIKFWILCFRYLISNKDFNVLHCHDLTGLPPAVWFKLIFPRTKIIYDSHEIYPDAVREKLGNLVGFPFLMLEKFCIKFVNKIIGISVPQGELMKKRYHIRHFLFLPNFPTRKEFFAEEKSPNEKVTIVYSGGIHKNRGYEQLVEAIYKLSRGRDDFIVQLVGDGPLRSKVEKMVNKKGLKSFIELIGSVHYTEVKNYLNNADIGIALYQPTTNSNYGLSNKIFEYIICELPVIYPFYKGSTFYLKRIGGINVNPTSSNDIASKIEFLITHPKVREKIKEEERNLAPDVVWERVENNLRDLYMEILTV